ncbi:MAG: hypothetical protein ABEJ02_01005 [Candidatus Paceibacteria bacterium]
MSEYNNGQPPEEPEPKEEREKDEELISKIEDAKSGLETYVNNDNAILGPFRHIDLLDEYFVEAENRSVDVTEKPEGYKELLREAYEKFYEQNLSEIEQYLEGNSDEDEWGEIFEADKVKFEEVIYKMEQRKEGLREAGVDIETVNDFLERLNKIQRVFEHAE